MTWPILIRDRSFDLERHVVRVALADAGVNGSARRVHLGLPLADALSVEATVATLSSRVCATVGRRTRLEGRITRWLTGSPLAETFANLFDISPEVAHPRPGWRRATPSDVDHVTRTARAGRRTARRTSLTYCRNRASWLTSRSRRRPSRRTAVAVVARSSSNARPAVDLRRTPNDAQRAAGVEKPISARAFRWPTPSVRQAHGGSVTDFVMASTSGALRRLLADRGEALKKDLVAFVPINVRGEGDTAELGNQISGMLVALHTDLDDPVVRLKAIAQDSARTVGVQRHLGARMFQEYLGCSDRRSCHSAPSQSRVLDSSTTCRMANLMFSSVPGPPIPLWLSGHRRRVGRPGRAASRARLR